MAKTKLTAAEKERRKHERKAKAMNKAEAKAYGPLFAELAPVHTPDEAEVNWRLLKAGVAEMGFNHPFHRAYDWILLRAVERFAVELWGDVAVEIARGMRQTFSSNPSMNRSLWCNILAGLQPPSNWRMRLETRPEWVSIPYNREGVRVVYDPWVCPSPTIPREEFARRFPTLLVEADPPTADDSRMAVVLEMIGRKI